jgi:hypothetical protein
MGGKKKLSRTTGCCGKNRFRDRGLGQGEATVGAAFEDPVLAVEDVEVAVHLEEHPGDEQAYGVEVLQVRKLLGKIKEDVQGNALMGGNAVGVVVVPLPMDAPGHGIEPGTLGDERVRGQSGGGLRCGQRPGGVLGFGIRVGSLSRVTTSDPYPRKR